MSSANGTPSRLGLVGNTPLPAAELLAEGLAKVHEAWQYLRVSRSFLYSLMDRGELPYVKIGRCRRVPWVALRRYAASHLVSA